MPSKTQETKDGQKARYLKQMEARQASLKDKGIPEAAIAKDPKVKHYKAKIKQIKGAMARITFLEDQTKQLLEKKEQRRAEAEAARAAIIAGEKKVKEKKKTEEKPAPGKGKAKGAAAGKAPAKGKQETKKKAK
jgi:hypothetical protein